VEQAPEQDNFQTEQQESQRTQQQRHHQGHWERTVRITPETVVVAELEVVEQMAARAETVEVVTTVVPVVTQDRI
jgi:hypothetical protein